MIRLCKYNQENVLEKVRHGEIDAVALSHSNLIDDIILEMHKTKIFQIYVRIIPLSRMNWSGPAQLRRK